MATPLSPSASVGLKAHPSFLPQVTLDSQGHPQSPPASILLRLGWVGFSFSY